MLIRITSGVCLGGGRDAWPGEEHDLEEHHARRLIAYGLAIALPPVSAPAVMGAREVETLTAADEFRAREPEPDNREPRIVRGGQE